MLTGDIATTKIVANDNATAAKSLGWKISYNDVYPVIGMSDWTPYAQKLKDSGTKGLIWVGEPEGLGGLMGALRDIGYKLDFVRADANHYDRKLIDTAGSALADRNVYVSSAFYPVRAGEADERDRRVPPACSSSTSRAARAAPTSGCRRGRRGCCSPRRPASCGNDLTRTCVYDAAKKITSWTGGGLHAETSTRHDRRDRSASRSSRPRPTGFVLVTDTKPNDGIYNCSPKNLFTLPPDPADVTTLADVGKSIGDMK